MVWDVAPLPALHDLSPTAVLQVQRILLQAFTNMLQHARASSVSVSARLVGEGGTQRVCLVLADNGAGFDSAASSRGQGLASMRQRAEAIGARLHIDSAVGAGTRVQLDWPVDAAQPANGGAGDAAASRPGNAFTPPPKRSLS